MRFMRQSLLACAVLYSQVSPAGSLPQNPQIAPAPIASPKTSQSLEIANLLPIGNVHVEAMRLEPSPRLTELGRKLQAAMQKRPQWFMAQVQKAKPGQPIPYNTKLGLTKAEYKEFMSSFPTKMQLHKVGEGDLTIKADGTKRIFDGGTDLTDFTGIEVDLAQRTVKTPRGLLRKTTPIKANAGQAAIGQWDGTEWKLENVIHVDNPALLTGSIVEFSLGKVKASGKAQLRYKAQQVEAGKPKANFEYILRYDAHAGGGVE